MCMIFKVTGIKNVLHAPFSEEQKKDIYELNKIHLNLHTNIIDTNTTQFTSKYSNTCLKEMSEKL